MAQLNFEITNQTIKRTDSFLPKSKSVNYLVAHFNFNTDDWADMPLKTAIFQMEDGTAYKSVLNDSGDCLVPWEVLEEPGTIFVSVFSGERITTGKARVRIGESGYVEDAQNQIEPTPDIYDQLMSVVNELQSVVDEVEDLSTSIDGGSFTDWD